MAAAVCRGVQTTHRFVAIDRASTVAYAEPHPDAATTSAAQSLRHLSTGVPSTIHTILTDEGLQFPKRALNSYAVAHIADRPGCAHGVEHRLTRVRHPRTNGQGARMSRTRKEATVKQAHYQPHHRLTGRRQAWPMGLHLRHAPQNSPGTHP